MLGISSGLIYANWIMACPEIGDTYQGGLVFYLDPTGCGGLIAAPSDQSTSAEWGCVGDAITGTGTTVGTGAQNTIDILAGCSESGIAAKICDDLSLNGYDDWFLPSRDALDLIYHNLQQNGLGGFLTTGATAYYWSSSEHDADKGKAMWIGSGGPSHNHLGASGDKDNNWRVRAIRAF